MRSPLPWRSVVRLHVGGSLVTFVSHLNRKDRSATAPAPAQDLR